MQLVNFDRIISGIRKDISRIAREICAVKSCSIGYNLLGIYDSDAAAILAGGTDGDWYELSQTNIYGLPEGTIKRIRT